MTVNVFYDTEFFEDGEIIDLISIGMVVVPDHGHIRKLYIVNEDFDTQRMLKHPNADWLMKNVFNSIEHEKIYAEDRLVDIVITDLYGMPKSGIANEIVYMLEQFAKQNIELWAYYAAYDHVALAQLWGRMLEMPSEIVPMYTNDIMTLSALKGHPALPYQVAGNHNALKDAEHNYEVWKHLKSL